MSAHRLTDWLLKHVRVRVRVHVRVHVRVQCLRNHVRQPVRLAASRSICSWLNRLLACPRPDPAWACPGPWSEDLGTHSNYRLFLAPGQVSHEAKQKDLALSKSKSESIARQTVRHVHLVQAHLYPQIQYVYAALASRTTFTNRNNDYNLPCTSHKDREREMNMITWASKYFIARFFVTLFDNLTARQATTCSHLIIKGA